MSQEGNTTDAAGTAEQDQGSELTFDSWYGQQEELIRSLVDTRLQASAQEERATRQKLEKELRATAKKLEVGSEAQRTLTATADKLSTAERRIQFLEQANKTIDDVKLAWLAVSGGGYDAKDGRFDFEKLKADHPKLFVEVASTKGNAGTGTNTDLGDRKFSMNRWLRAAIR